MVWILFCIQYCLAVVVLVICLVLFFALDLKNNATHFQPHLEIYVGLYVVGIIFFVVYHISRKSFSIYVENCNKWFQHQLKFIKRKLFVSHNFDNSTSAKDGVILSNSSSCNKRVKISSGKFGLKLGVKTFVVVFITVIMVELITFIQQKLQENNCRLTKKGLFFTTQLIYILFQTHFVLTTRQEDIDKFSHLAYFGVAHSMATTVCTGILLTAQDCLLKLYYYENSVSETVLSSNNNSAIISQEESTLPFSLDSSLLAFQNESVFEINFRKNGTCSFKSYIDRIHDQIKPFSFHLCMLYVHCCATLLGLLMLHLRKKIHKPSSTTNFFTYIHPSTETFSAGAALSLIVLGIIISVLTITAENNFYVTIFLLFLHLQASCVGIVALYKIAHVRCSRKVISSKNHAVFVIFYFFVTLSGVLKIITININRDSEEFASKCLETAVEVVDMIQAFVNALLILIGFYAKIIIGEVSSENKMPTKILIHLAATNLAAMISSVFNSKNEFSTFVDRLYKSAGRDDNLFSSEIAWTVIESILVPCDEFYRFFTIVCLIKLHKTWSPDEHSPPNLHTRF